MITQERFTKLSDLPDDVLAELVEAGGEKMSSQIVSMLQQYGEMDADEVVVCFWIVHQRKVSRDSVLTRLSELYQDGLIKRIKRGVYAPKEIS